MSDAQPTIFVLSNMREFGGAERSIATLVPYLAQAANLRIYVANDHHRRDLAQLGLSNMELAELPVSNSPFALLKAVLVLARDCLRYTPAAMLANGHKGALLLALLRCVLFWRRLPTVIYVRDFDYYTLPFILWALPAALYVAPTQPIFDFERYRKWGLGRHRCEVIPNAVPAPVLREPGTPEAPYFACCARITPWKGIDVLLRAMALMVMKEPSARLRIYGEIVDESYYASLRRLQSELGLDEAVSFEPFTREIGSVYASGMFFVIPSLSILPGPESFCRIIIEAWSYAKPVIAFAVGGPGTLIRDGEDGFLVPEGDLEILADRMISLFVDPARRARLGAAGAARVQTEFAPQAVAQRVIGRLLPGKTQPDFGEHSAPVTSTLSAPAPSV